MLLLSIRANEHAGVLVPLRIPEGLLLLPPTTRSKVDELLLAQTDSISNPIMV